jgi:4a-hydroxytetrahydrobiopterin dehydratase
VAEELTAMKCEACSGSTPSLTAGEISQMRTELDTDWAVADNKQLRREWKSKNFNTAFSLATSIALLAQQEGHHPDLEVGWGRLVCVLTTHAIGGLSKNDFIMAAKIDRLESA